MDFIRNIIVCTFLLVSTDLLGDFDKGLAAYSNGDYATALIEFEKAAAQGHANAQYGLGVLHTYGQGVKQDDFKAVEWYQKASVQGKADAQTNLAMMYAKGRGVKQDDFQAVEWYQKAAAQGNAISQFHLALRYANGQGVKQDDFKAFEWYQKAAAQGDADAQNNLGFMYANGLGVKKAIRRQKYGSERLAITRVGKGVKTMPRSIKDENRVTKLRAILGQRGRFWVRVNLCKLDLPRQLT